LPRVIGIDNAVEWIAAGAEKRPDAALKDGALMPLLRQSNYKPLRCL
jgi:hypothetical protein